MTGDIHKMDGQISCQAEMKPSFKETFSLAQKHPKSIIKIQANVRGHLCRKKYSAMKSAKQSARNKVKKPQKANKQDGAGDVVAKLSHRSAEVIFKGGGMPPRGPDSYRNGLVYAKALASLPDYSSFATRETEK